MNLGSLKPSCQITADVSIIHLKLRENFIGTSCSNTKYGHKWDGNEKFLSSLVGHKRASESRDFLASLKKTFKLSP